MKWLRLDMKLFAYIYSEARFLFVSKYFLENVAYVGLRLCCSHTIRMRKYILIASGAESFSADGRPIGFEDWCDVTRCRR